MSSPQRPNPKPAGSKTPAKAVLTSPPGREPAGQRPSRGAIIVAARGLTDQGRVRLNNEDNLAARDLSTGETFTGPFEFTRSLGPRGLMLMVADGMGGQACGELASRMSCELVPTRLLEELAQTQAPGRDELARSLARALEAANRSILQAAQAEAACQGMGTTVTAVALLGSTAVVGQVGDSRAYLLRGGQFVQLTRDQTFLNYLIEMGAIGREEAAGDPRRNILIQALGTTAKLNVALTAVELCRGDQLLVMSDGLYSMVPPERMLEIAASADDPETRCLRLVEEANGHGGADNVTVVLAELRGDGLPPCDPAGALRIQFLSPTPEMPPT